MNRRLLLDLFCGAGGAATGYVRAGFDVVGVDIVDQPDYPYTFVRDEALIYLSGHWRDFDAIHASPPCQASSALTKGTNNGRVFPNLISATRDMLVRIGRPAVIENVQGSQLRRDLTLCGEMFGLDVIRHRYFEAHGWAAVQPEHPPHRGRVSGWRHGTFYPGPYVAVYGDGGGKGSIAEWQRAMGIDWTQDRRGLAEAVPPAYTELVGRQMLTCGGKR